jgi:hypothetical protein
MGMVCHQHIGMDGAIELLRGLAQAIQVGEVVLVVEEARAAVVAALYEMLRHPRHIESRQAGHEWDKSWKNRRSVSVYQTH